MIIKYLTIIYFIPTFNIFLSETTFGKEKSIFNFVIGKLLIN